MKIPLRFAKEMSTNKVYKLKKAHYELKQSPRVWFGRFSKVMLGTENKQK